MFGRKGQSAMEYLMTYGWAILVVMVVGIAMWQLGIFNTGVVPMTSTGFAKIKPQLAGSGMKANGEFTGTFTNGIGTKLTIMQVTVTVDKATPCTFSVNGVARNPDCFAPGDLNPPTTGKDISSGDNFCFTIGSCATGISPKKGSPFNAAVDIDYKVTIGGQTLSHTDHGAIRGAYE